MSQRSPTNLNTPRNIALQKGTVPAGFAEPDLHGVQVPPYRDEAERPSSGFGSPSPIRPEPFTTRGG